jgi:alpha-tubulin suppressor-like RCC1 family protein
VTVTAIASHASTTCVLLSTGTVRCWGSNQSGQFGDGMMNTNSATPVAFGGVTPLTGLIGVASGGNHQCVLLSGGASKCAGLNYSGQLGNGGTAPSPTPVSVTVSGASPAVQLAAAFDSTCARVGSNVKCFGNDATGMLGDGALASLNATTITAGYDHYCAIISGGTVKCWGNNSRGQLGNGMNMNFSATPVTVTGLTGATAISAGAFFSCAIVSGGAVKCWGYNGNGELGNGDATSHGQDSTTPVSVLNLSGAAVAIASGYQNTCVAISGGTVNCWGSNFKGQIGNGASGGISGWAQPVAGLTGASALAAGVAHICAIVADGPVKCWGDNAALQLGVTTPAFSTSPVSVTGW